MPLYDCQALLCCFDVFFSDRLGYLRAPNTERTMGNPRMTAALAGEKTFIGSPCRKHPESLRYVSSGRCRQCTVEGAKVRENAIKVAMRQAASARRVG